MIRAVVLWALVLVAWPANAEECVTCWSAKCPALEGYKPRCEPPKRKTERAAPATTKESPAAREDAAPAASHGDRAWLDRAEARLRTLLSGNNGQGLANSVLAIVHSTGRNPTLAEPVIRRVGDSLTVRVQVDWQGGFSGTPYSTVVVWELTRRKHLRAEMIIDTAPTPVFNQAKLDTWFRTECYAALRASVGD